jgi:hypothetical protein
MTYTIHRNPEHLIDVVQLANGSRVTVLPKGLVKSGDDLIKGRVPTWLPA